MSENFEPEFYAELEPEVEEIIAEPDVPPVSSQPHDWTISTLRDKYERGQINLQPHYQREYVWEQKPELPSRLIESLLLQIPVPPLYFVRLNTGKIEVVDGQQRLTTLMRFVSNEFRLQKLQKLNSLNGKLFIELSERDQEKIADATIRSIVIDAGTNSDLRYEIFERLNRGAMALNEQEIRNCAYRGLFCDLLGELEQHANWRKVKGTPKPEPRFIEREMILRFFTFANRIEHYAGNLKKFLNDYMSKHAPNETEKINELRKMFVQTMQNVYTVFGEHSARIYSVDDGLQVSKWETKFSVSALDIQASSLIGYSPTKIQSAAAAIFEAYKFYLTTNPQVRQAISRRPAATDATKARWFGFKMVVHELMNTNPASESDVLFQAKTLFRIEYFSAAGAIAGVQLEKHLKELCVKHITGFSLTGTEGIGKVNGLLINAGVFDSTQGRRVGVLGDIRNRCDHAVAHPPSKNDVWDLIEGVQNLMKAYPV